MIPVLTAINLGVNVLGIFSGLVTSLKNVGVPAANIPTVLSGIVALSPAPAVNAICQTLLAQSANADIVKAEATKLAEVANVPASVAGLIPQLMASAGNPAQVILLVQAIEAAMNSTGSGSGLLNLL